MLLTKFHIAQLAKCYRVTEKEILILLGSIIEKDYTSLFFEKNFQITDADLQILLKYIERVALGEPISKIIQQKEFYGIKFKTCSDTLDPRPETELIVDLFMKYFPDKTGHYEIMDLGAGTGCIGLSILSYYKNSVCLFIDIDDKALAVAQHNANALTLVKLCKFQKSDWVSEVVGEYDAIVSNPPYIADDYELPAEVLFDPRIALISGKDGMDAHSTILSTAHLFLKKNGILFLEIGYDQREKIEKVNTKLKVVEVVKDINRVDRIFVFSR
ncbi:MAG: peptide chain release factor N(5)-glutamine methyltransferase [Holosporales bacterium]|jgi:release factor glutamine methyltransferase|nr:peptide chain release factor N(5)-glutamine methyltransferase [Holosporales bacterium]